jgi:Transmembrane secretion effector
VRWTLLIAAGSFLPGLVSVRWLGLPVVDRPDMEVVPRPVPDVAVEPEPEDGPVMVLVDYNVARGLQEQFVESMEELRVVRRRNGASRWGLFEDANRPGRFVESFVMPSWGGYLLQRGRYTAADLRVYDAAMRLNTPPREPSVSYFVHPESAFAYRRRVRWRRLRGMDRALENGAPGR